MGVILPLLALIRRGASAYDHEGPGDGQGAEIGQKFWTGWSLFRAGPVVPDPVQAGTMLT